MKIRVTFEVDDTDRVAISVTDGTGFKNATREQIVTWIENVVAEELGGLRLRFDNATKLVLGEIDHE